MPRLYGRLPRRYNPAIPHLSAVAAGRMKMLPPVPVNIDYASPLPVDLGMMCNDRVGCCTSAGAYHARQVWTRYVTGITQTASDEEVLRFYEECTGYDPHDPTTDRGAVEQDVLTYWLRTGLPISADPVPQRNRLLAMLEVDPRDWDDVRRTIWECGVCYIGFQVPRWFEQEELPELWDVRYGADNSAVGGHCVVLVGADLATVELISWGRRYRMTKDFFQTFTDEAYALVSPDWVTATGRTPLGLSPTELETLIEGLR